MKAATRSTRAVCAGAILIVAMLGGLAAQQAPQQPQPRIAAVDLQFDAASVERGQQLLVSECGFCHGSNARGGSRGPDLTRLVLGPGADGRKQRGGFLS